MNAPARITTTEPVYLMSYYGGRMVERGYYRNAADAKAVTPEVGRWIPTGDPNIWRSEDGRWLIADSRWCNRMAKRDPEYFA